MAAKKALAGLRVLELSRFVAGAYCAKLLAELGAEVIKVEPIEGDETRRRGPFRQDKCNPECSALFLYLGASKMSVTLDINMVTGREILHKLCQRADALVIEDSCENITRLQPGPHGWMEAYPQLVVAAITPFGLTGPFKNLKSYYLNTFACGGEASFLPSDKGFELYPDRPPLRMGGFVSEYSTGVAASTAVLASLFRRETLGRGELIDVSKQEVLLNLVRFELCTFNDGIVTSRATRAWPIGGLMLCQDGWVLVLLLNETMWNRLVQVMGNPEWTKEGWAQYSYVASSILKPDLYTPELYQAQARVNERLQEWCSRFTRDELCHMVQNAGSSAGPINSVDELMNSGQLKWRDFFIEVDHPVAGRLKYPGAPYKMGATPARIERHAPLVGEHNQAIYCDMLGYSHEELVRLRQAGVV